MKNVKISVCQLKVKPVAHFSEFADQVHDLIRQVPGDADYVLFAELFTIGLMGSFPDYETMQDKEIVSISQYTNDYIELFKNIAIQRKQVIIAGSHVEEWEGNYYNTCYVFKEDGSFEYHRKTHLFSAEKHFDISEGDDYEVLEIGPAKIGIAICYESEIPEISRILSVKGAEIIFCPSYTISEHGFWRVRHCSQARAIENQVYFVHCPTVGGAGKMPDGYGRSAIFSPCDQPWNPDGVVVEARNNENMVITGEVDIDELYVNRKNGAAPTFNDRIRRADLYRKFPPFK